MSTSRYQKVSKGIKVDDKSGLIAVNIIKKAGHKVTSKKIVDDNISMIRLELMRSIYEEGADAVVLTGGTGLAKRDVTIESVKPLLDKELDGFAEVFRLVSYKEIGTPAYMSRCIAGSIDGRIIYCLPGSPNAVKTGLELILPELSHATYIVRM